MEIILKSEQNLRQALREAGYHENINRQNGQISYEHNLSGSDYPRFHIYTSFQDKNIVLKLHLDQKRPSYSGSSAHNGEYSGPVVESEAERIKNILKIYNS